MSNSHYAYDILSLLESSFDDEQQLRQTRCLQPAPTLHQLKIESLDGVGNPGGDNRVQPMQTTSHLGAHSQTVPNSIDGHSSACDTGEDGGLFPNNLHCLQGCVSKLESNSHHSHICGPPIAIHQAGGSHFSSALLLKKGSLEAQPQTFLTRDQDECSLELLYHNRSPQLPTAHLLPHLLLDNPGIQIESHADRYSAEARVSNSYIMDARACQQKQQSAFRTINLSPMCDSQPCPRIDVPPQEKTPPTKTTTVIPLPRAMISTTLRCPARAKPSRFCHLCTRPSKPENLLVCSNVRNGTCRKVICDKCTRIFAWDLTRLREDSSWTCTHCNRVSRLAPDQH